MAWPRIVLFAALAAAAAGPAWAAPAWAAPTTTTTARAGVDVLVIDGKGWGHGVGMAQDGILAMGRAGATTQQMMSAFYPGTTIGKRSGTVRVRVLATTSTEVALQLPDGGRIEAEGDGFPVNVRPGDQVMVGYGEGGWWVRRPGSTASAASSGPGEAASDTSTTTSTAPSTSTSTPTSSTSTSTTSTTIGLVPGDPPTTDPMATTTTTEDKQNLRDQPDGSRRSIGILRVRPTGAGSVGLPARAARYRGVLEAAPDKGGLRLVNAVDVEAYLRGMGEVRDSRWPAAALRMQAIAARTYALRAMAAGGEICDDQRCQVYLGAQAEYAAMNKAVADTAGQVVLHKGKLASTVYSANAGGHSASREEGFGATSSGYPYLRPAPYKTGDAMPWLVRVGFPDVAARLGYQGTLRSVSVAKRGPSGRALEVLLGGTAGTQVVTGRLFDARIGLKSTLFTLRTEHAAIAPAPPEAELDEQAPPEQAVALPPRPPDPPLPSALQARLDGTTTTRAGRREALATATPPRGGTTNTPLALFVLAALGVTAGAAAASRRSSPGGPRPS